MYNSDRYLDAVYVVSDIIKKWDQQEIHQAWENSLSEAIIAALFNANLLKV